MQEFGGLIGSRDLAKKQSACSKAGESQDVATEWQILQQPEILRDFPTHYQADEVGNISSDPVDHQNGGFCEKMQGQKSLRCFKPCFKFPK